MNVPSLRQTSMKARVKKFGAGWTAYATMEANFDERPSGEIWRRLDSHACLQCKIAIVP